MNAQSPPLKNLHHLFIKNRDDFIHKNVNSCTDPIQKNFAQAIEKFENISLVSSQFNHSLRLHVYGRVMKSLTQEQVKKGIQQELELLATSTKMLTGSVSTFEKSAALLTDPSKADEKTRKNVHAQLSRAKHLVELTESSVNYLNKALTNPWFKASKIAE